MSNLRKTVLSRGTPRQPRFSVGSTKDYSPVKWPRYFSDEKVLRVNNDTFHMYLAGKSGPVLVLIHGGGYSALTWALFTEEITNKIECQVVAIDLRGHGNTHTNDESSLALETLAQDVSDILHTYYGDNLPPVVLIGHSLGGAVAVAASALIPTVIGVCVIDVVEGTALESLSGMQSILRGRPTSFKTIEDAIMWCFRSGQTHNLEAARVSMPGQIISISTGILASNEKSENDATNTDDKTDDHKDEKPPTLRLVHQRSADAIEEENENEEEYLEINDKHTNDVEFAKAAKKPPTGDGAHNEGSNFKVPVAIDKKNAYTWRIDLSKTEPYWNGWFKGLSQKFLDIQAPKVLLLANIHGLDTTLTVGQMQGKFQLQVLPRSGHAIHEDQPHHVADIIAGFLVKQKLAESKNGFTPTMPAC